MDGPIEYIFNTIEQHLTDYQFTVADGVALQQALNKIVTGINHFEEYFINCGY